MRTCAICGKGSIMGGKRKLLRGHYNLTKTERKYPNLQWVRLLGTLSSGKIGKRVKACTNCIRNIQKSR